MDAWTATAMTLPITEQGGVRKGWRIPSVVALLLAVAHAAIGQPVFRQTGNTLLMSNVDVQVQYNLATGMADFVWQNSLIINSFYGAVNLTNYITGNIYSNHTWAVVSSNQVVVTSTGGTLPTMKQYFILDQSDSFLTRVEVDGANLSSSWMAPVVMSTTGGVDIGSYDDDRALDVPFDNDHFVTYDAMPINNSSTSYEVGAFYDNTTRIGLVVGSVTHDTWKTGVYFSGSGDKLNALNVFGGVSCPWDVAPHGPVVGNVISSPTVFVGFGDDWRTTLENYANENAAQVPKLAWTNGVPFGWNSWYAFGTSINYTDATSVSAFIKNNLRTNNFDDNGVVYVNLDSYWSNLSASQLQDFVDQCHSYGQKAGIYLAPFAWFGSANNISNSTVEGSSFLYSDIALRTSGGLLETNDSGIALDPTHPGTQQRIDYYADQFLDYGFDYVKLDFLSHGALEGVHYDSSITTGIQAYNAGMQYILADLGGTMYVSESIAPIFPYQYANSRRIACDTANTISETEYEMQSVNYGWWISGRLYQYNDPDLMEFAGATAYENQSRLISGVVSGTVFLNSDNLTSAAGQSLAITCLTNAAINAVARAGQSFRPIEGNTGTSASDAYVGQVGTNWYLAVFNFGSSAVTETNDLTRAGVPAATCGAIDLWSGALSAVTENSLITQLAAKQSKLLQLVSTPMFALSASPAQQIVNSGNSTNLTVNVVASACFTGTITLSVSGLPAGVAGGFAPPTLGGAGSSVLTLTTSNTVPSGSYPFTIAGISTNLTNSTGAILVVGRGVAADLRWNSTSSSAWDVVSSNWFNLGTGSADQFYPGDMVLFDDTAGVVTSVTIGSGMQVTPGSMTNNSSINNFTISGAGTIDGVGGIVKRGTSTLTLSTANSFTGGLNIQGGTVKIGTASALGATNGVVTITNGGTLDLSGYSLGVQPVVCSGTGTSGNGALINSGSPVYDSPGGLLNVTLAGNATFGGPTRWDLGSSAGGVLSTGGEPYNVTILGVSGGIYFEWMDLSADANLANINVMPGATLGDKGTTTLGNPTNAVNVFSNALLTFYNNGSQNVQLNKKVVIYDGGTVQNGGGASIAISPITLSTNAAGAAGNCTLNVGSTSLILSNAIGGPGNLIKIGSSPLKLAGTNTYTGATSVNAGKLYLIGAGSISNSSTISLAAGTTLDASGRTDGTLSLAGGQVLEGVGVINGSLQVNSGATVSPGASGAGVLTVNSGVTLKGTTAMTLAAATNTVLTAGSIGYGGTLSLALTAGTPTPGSSFQLFSATTYTGSFSNFVPAQPGLGLMWATNLLKTNGVLGVSALPRPKISAVSQAGTNLVFKGTNGTPGYSYRVLASTNVTLPFNHWTILATNQFDGSGNFGVTNSTTSPGRFYSIQAL